MKMKSKTLPPHLLFLPLNPLSHTKVSTSFLPLISHLFISFEIEHTDKIYSRAGIRYAIYCWGFAFLLVVTAFAMAIVPFVAGRYYLGAGLTVVSLLLLVVSAVVFWRAWPNYLILDYSNRVMKIRKNWTLCPGYTTIIPVDEVERVFWDRIQFDEVLLQHPHTTHIQITLSNRRQTSPP